jgi:hypothetical protein
MIDRKDVVPMMEKALPEFSAWFVEQGLGTDRADPDNETGHDNHTFLTALRTYTEAILAAPPNALTNQILDRICDFVEDVITNGDVFASSAACIEFVHSLSRRDPHFADVYRCLGSGSKKCWQEFDEF